MFVLCSSLIRHKGFSGLSDSEPVSFPWLTRLCNICWNRVIEFTLNFVQDHNKFLDMKKWTWHSFPVISCSEIWYLGSNQSSSDISSVINFHLKNPITLYIFFANSLPYFQNRFWLDRLLKSFSPLLFSKLQSKKKIMKTFFWMQLSAFSSALQ